MSDHQILARLFGCIGGILAVTGAVLWFTVPIRPMFPPYAASAFLALVCAAWFWRRARGKQPPRP
jgi:hypothetical protein